MNAPAQVSTLYTYRGQRYPVYLKQWNVMQFITPMAKYFCRGEGIDVGAGKWPLPGAHPIDLTNGHNAEALPNGQWDYIFSSHCLEHLSNTVAVLEHWKTRIRPGGTLFLYLPSADMEYWLPQNCRKHLHSWTPQQMAKLVSDLGFVDVIHSERDLAWSFSVVGFAP